MGSDYSNTDESMAEVLQAMQAYLPDTLRAVAGTYPEQAAAEYNVMKEYSPKIAELQYDTIMGPGRKLAEAGRELSRDEQLGAAKTELEIARGSGRDLAGEALDLQELVDPEATAARKAIGSGITKSLDSIDPNTLTDGELESVSRGLGRNAYEIATPMSQINDAMTFGDALASRRGEYRDTLQTAAAASPATKTGISGFEAATRRTLTPNFGTSQYTSIQQPGVATSNSFGQNYMNNATAIEQTTKQKQKDALDMFGQVTEGLGNLGSVVGGI